mgnify:FL=1
MKKRLFVKMLRQKRLVPPAIISTIEKHARFIVIRLQGSIDMSTVAALEVFGDKWQRQDDFEPKNILLDFQKVTHADSAAVAILIQATVSLKKQHHELGVININEQLRFMLELFKVSNVISLFHNESAAVKELSKE